MGKTRECLILVMSVVLVFVVFLLVSAKADEIELEHAGLTLIADLSLASGKNLKRHGVVLLLHDAVKHKRSSDVDALRTALLARGANVLAINLSLGLNARRGRFDCAIEQDHLYVDALPEIHAWVKWLQHRKTSNIALLGIGRGANQIALYGSKTTQKSVRSIILLAPSATTASRKAQAYQQLHGKPLPDLLFEAEEKINAELAGALLADVGFFDCPNARVTARSFASYYGEHPQFELTRLIGLIKKSLLIITGELGGDSEQLISALQQLEARANLRLDVIEAVDLRFERGSMGQVADRIKLFRTETKGR